MGMIYVNTCQNCGKQFETRRIVVSKFCSDACRQKSYRERNSVTPKSKPGRCVRCGKSCDPKSRYCSSGCKAMTNREKHTATFRLMKSLYGWGDFDTWGKIDGRWKEAYEQLEAAGYKYDAFMRTWRNPALERKLDLMGDD